MTYDDALADLAARLLEDALVAANGNRAAAAASLGMPLRRLERLVAVHVGGERLQQLAATHGWPGVAERAAKARAALGAKRSGVVRSA